MFKLPSSSIPSFISSTAKHSKTGHAYLFVIGNIQSVTSQIFGVVSPLGENLDYFDTLGCDI